MLNCSQSPRTGVGGESRRAFRSAACSRANASVISHPGFYGSGWGDGNGLDGNTGLGIGGKPFLLWAHDWYVHQQRKMVTKCSRK